MKPVWLALVSLAGAGTLAARSGNAAPPKPLAAGRHVVAVPATATAPPGARPRVTVVAHPAFRCPRPAATRVTAALGRGRTVALTFDDGPGPAMLQIVGVLKANGVNRATFFDTGRHDAEFPAAVRKVSAMGYLIGDHTWDHRYPRRVRGGWTLAYLRDQLGRTARQQRALTGRPTCFFRPPGGHLDNVLAAARAQRMSVVMWSVDSYDWKQPGRLEPTYLNRLVADATRVKPGQNHPIILMHAAKASYEPNSVVSPYRGNTVAALPRIIAWYRGHGYTFVDLLGRH